MNFGGWGNSAHALEEIRDGKQQPVTEQHRGKIEPGKWYTLKLVVAGDRVEGFLDGKSVAVLQRAPAAKFHAVAGIDRKANELVIKAVNGEKNAVAMTLNLAGAKVGPGRVIHLQGDLEAENSVAEPELIAPRADPFELTGASTKIQLPPASFTIYRLPLK
jgi:alpha-L-arabinofuranosidase